MGKTGKQRKAALVQSRQSSTSESDNKRSISVSVAIAAAVVCIAAVATHSWFASWESSPVFPDSSNLVSHILATGGECIEPTHNTSKLPLSLGYVTPWNSAGYETALKFKSKLTHVSPVWFQIKRRGADTFVIEGEQDVDPTWVKNMQNVSAVSGRGVAVMPRVIVEGFGTQDLSALLFSDSERRQFGLTLSRLCTRHALDGVMLELWSRLQVTPEIRPALTSLIANVGRRLRKQNFKFGIIVPPFKESFGARELGILAPNVDIVFVNTYDFSSPTTAGPNAPFDWVAAAIRDIKNTSPDANQKLAMGLNFYGNIYGAGGAQAVVQNTFVDMLRAHGAATHVSWNTRAQEHVFSWSVGGSRYVVYYPTQESIHARVRLAQQLGVGIGIWELGQGFDHFYDVI